MTRGHEEEPKRPDDIAPDLAAVRAELAKCIAAEAAARGQIAYLTKWLEDNEKMSEGALDAERNAQMVLPEIWRPSAPSLQIVLLRKLLPVMRLHS